MKMLRRVGLMGLLMVARTLLAQGAAPVAAQSAAVPEPATTGMPLIGTFQGTMETTPTPRRLMIRVFEGPDHRVAAYLVNLDQGGMDRRQIADSVQLLSGGVRLVFGGRARYVAVMSTDGTTMRGAATSGTTTLPFTLTRTTASTEFRATGSPAPTFVTVAKDVQLEVLDWGGTGRPLVLLSGLGFSAHIFNSFAAKLTDTYRVIGISRRGYGASSIPNSGYRTDSLADDVLAVLDSLKLAKPVLAAWSFGGAEMSSIATRAPDRVAGLVYLEAGYGYAYYNGLAGNLNFSAVEVRRRLEALSDPGMAMMVGADQQNAIRELLENAMPDLLRDARAAMDVPSASSAPPGPSTAYEAVPTAIFEGVQKHTRIPVPALVFFASPQPIPPGVDEATRAVIGAVNKYAQKQSTAFEQGVPSAKVIRIPNANHAVFMSHEADVLRELRAFIAGLPNPR